MLRRCLASGDVLYRSRLRSLRLPAWSLPPSRIRNTTSMFHAVLLSPSMALVAPASGSLFGDSDRDFFLLAALVAENRSQLVRPPRFGQRGDRSGWLRYRRFKRLKNRSPFGDSAASVACAGGGSAGRWVRCANPRLRASLIVRPFNLDRFDCIGS